MWTVTVEPGVPQDQRELRRLQDVKLDSLVVVTGEKHVHWCGLVSHRSQEVTVEGVGREWLRQWDPVNPQLCGELLINEADVGPRVDKGGEGGPVAGAWHDLRVED